VNVTAIILAAGASRRMSTQKLLLPFAGKTVIEHVIDQVIAGGLTDIFVVVGADPAVAEVARRRNMRIARNADPDRGMLSSVRCGLRAVPDPSHAVLVVLGDQPSISPSLLRAMVRAAETYPGKILVPTSEGKRGHPLLFPATYRNEVLTKYDDDGLRGLLRTHAGDILELPADASVLADMDDLADYRRELKRHSDGPL
jgi:molybdenum cofactor cytidylyltransferase